MFCVSVHITTNDQWITNVTVNIEQKDK